MITTCQRIILAAQVSITSARFTADPLGDEAYFPLLAIDDPEELVELAGTIIHRAEHSNRRLATALYGVAIFAMQRAHRLNLST